MANIWGPKGVSPKILVIDIAHCTKHTILCIKNGKTICLKILFCKNIKTQYVIVPDLSN